MAKHHNPRIVTDGLKRCFDISSRRSYLGSGSLITDLSGNSNATIIGTGTFGLYDGVDSIDFNGSYGSNGISSGSVGVDSGSFSVSVWFRSTDTDRLNGSQGRVIVGTYGYRFPSPDTGWYIGTVWTGTYFRFNIFNGLGGSDLIDLPSGFYTSFLNKWTNIAGVFRAGSYIKIYQDGQLMGTANTSISILENQSSLFWARRSLQAQSNWAGQFSCGVYYDRDLSDSEIRQNFNALRGRYGI